jgi:hypothetical protein
LFFFNCETIFPMMLIMVINELNFSFLQIDANDEAAEQSASESSDDSDSDFESKLRERLKQKDDDGNNDDDDAAPILSRNSTPTAIAGNASAGNAVLASVGVSAFDRTITNQQQATPSALKPPLHTSNTPISSSGSSVASLIPAFGIASRSPATIQSQTSDNNDANANQTAPAPPVRKAVKRITRILRDDGKRITETIQIKFYLAESEVEKTLELQQQRESEKAALRAQHVKQQEMYKAERVNEDLKMENASSAVTAAPRTLGLKLGALKRKATLGAAAAAAAQSKQAAAAAAIADHKGMDIVIE